MKIAVLGSAPSSMHLAPYDDPEWLIWGCSPALYGVAKRSDFWFEMHRWEPEQPWFSVEYRAFMARHPHVWMADTPRPEIPNSVRYPIEQMLGIFGPYFFTSTIAYMLALAITMRPQTIGLWGVDMAAPEEYGDQRKGCQYFAQEARRQGIEVITPAQSDVLAPPPLYGFCELDHYWIKMRARKAEIEQRINGLNVEIDNKTKELMWLRGANEDLDHNRNTWGRQVFTGPVAPVQVSNVPRETSASDLSALAALPTPAKGNGQAMPDQP